MKLTTTTTLVTLLLALPLLAQSRKPQPFTVYPRFMDAVGCANFLSLHLPGVTTCAQHIEVDIMSPDSDTRVFAVVVTYTDSNGIPRQLQDGNVGAQLMTEGAEVTGVGTAAFFLADNLTEYHVTVVDDKGRAVSAVYVHP